MGGRADADGGAEETFTLLCEVGRREGDGLPEGATGAALLCYAAGRTEKEAVDATAALLRDAGLAPLDITSYGSLAERLEAGHDIAEEERALMARAEAENAVIVADLTTFWSEEERRALREEEEE